MQIAMANLTKKLHLKCKGNSYLANNLLGYVYDFWLTKPKLVSLKDIATSLVDLYNLRAHYDRNILSYLNMNSTRKNKWTTSGL